MISWTKLCHNACDGRTVPDDAVVAVVATVLTVLSVGVVGVDAVDCDSVVKVVVVALSRTHIQYHFTVQSKVNPIVCFVFTRS